MKSKPIAPWPFVEVRWIDSATSGGWAEIKDLPKPADMITRGWLVVDNDDYITLAGTYYHDDGIVQVGEFISIPRVSILPVNNIKVRKLKI